MTGFMGTFVPARDDTGCYMVNEWGELKFSAPDGMHRCVEVLKSYCENPDSPYQDFFCRGNWRPELDVSKSAGREYCIKLGSEANDKSGVVCTESLGTKIELFRNVCFCL
jgi:hypothetical protein